MQGETCGSPSNLRGVKGMLVDTCCTIPPSNPANKPYDLCSILRSPDTERIVLIRMTPKKEIETHEVVMRQGLADFFSKHRQSLAIKYYYREKDKDEELKLDLYSGVLLRDIYTIQERFHSEYLTMNYRLEYEHFAFNGLGIRHKGRDHYYFISNRCSLTLDQIEHLDDQTFKTLVSNLLASLAILHQKQYYHGDIKLQNMMYCAFDKVRYKLIDWGRLMSVKTMDESYYYGGSKQAGSPLGFYFMFRNTTRSKLGLPMGYERAVDLSFSLFEGKLPLNPVKSTLLLEYKDRFLPIWNRIQSSFRTTVEKYKDKDSIFSSGADSDVELFREYRYTMDTYNFGLVLLYLIFKHNLSYERYENFISHLIYYDSSMFRSAGEAYRAWNQKPSDIKSKKPSQKRKGKK